MRQLIIIGSGPAGFTAGIYAARAELKPLIVASSVETGGELTKTTEVENFPGFPEGIQGPDLMIKMQEQAEKFGAEVLYDDAVSVDLTGEVKKVTVGSGETYEALAVIYATGSAYRHLGLADEERLSGHGVSWCATCDGFFFRQKNIAVVGGGDSAMEEATFLTRFADKVTVIHRKDSLRASKIMQDRAMNDPKIEFAWNKEVTGSRVTPRSRASPSATPSPGGVLAPARRPVHRDRQRPADAPHPRADRPRLRGHDRGPGSFVEDQPPRVFAAGDVIDPTYRQAITAAGSGTVARPRRGEVPRRTRRRAGRPGRGRHARRAAIIDVEAARA